MDRSPLFRRRSFWQVLAILLAVGGGRATGEDDLPRFATEIAPLLKTQCVKCHGPAVREGDLFLGTAAGVVRGGKAGPIVRPHDLQRSLMWTRVAAGEMPPDRPLSASDQALLKRWIEGGAPGLVEMRRPTTEGQPPSAESDLAADHWAFRPLRRPALPTVRQATGLRTPIDYFIQEALEREGLSLRPAAPQLILARRARWALTGLPPTAEEAASLNGAPTDSTYERWVDRWLASPQFGPRWAKYWLDAAGYADSNGYFGADTDRPLAYRYRDYVVRACQQDKPYDQFIREQLAGDELIGFRPDQPATAEHIACLEATHFLRNGQDGSGESDGNPDEVRADRYYALESSQQLIGGTLLGLTVQCAKCHDHKYEPFSQKDYYGLQAILYPAFPLEQWVKPNERFVYAALPGEVAAWEAALARLDGQLAAQQSELAAWVQAERPTGERLFVDDFDDDGWAERWSATAPGDDAPGGAPAVQLAGDAAPLARVRDGRLHIVEGGGAGNRWLSTRQSFDWTPERTGESIQVTFDLVDHRLGAQGTPAARIGYYIALHDFDDNAPLEGGNILIDGHPETSTAVQVDYPGTDARSVGQIGSTGYRPGRNYGVRVTNMGEGKYRLEQLVDGLPEDKSLLLTAADLPAGGFGFEYCCGRSFVVDRVSVERYLQAAPGTPSSSPAPAATLASFEQRWKQRRSTRDRLQKERDQLAGQKPGKIAWLSDVTPTPPAVHRLIRGNYATRGEPVDPGVPAVLAGESPPFSVPPAAPGQRTTGRRLAFAQWLTRRNSRPAALLARVHVNRIWQHYFGRGLVATPDNLGLSGAAPTHPELLEWLAAELVDSGWQTATIHRWIVHSSTFRQTSSVTELAQQRDPSNQLWSRFPLLRLDAEALRDGLLAASGELDLELGGPYIPTQRDGDGEVLADEGTAGARRRSLYLYQRRTQIVSFLQLFDAPSIVFHSAQRNRSATPLQSLALRNSSFVLRRAEVLVERLEREASDEPARLATLYALVLTRHIADDERQAAREFLDAQTGRYPGQADARRRAWIDLVQALLVSNEFLYVE